MGRWDAGGERHLGLSLVRQWRPVQKTPASWAQSSFFPFKKEVMGLSESWSRTAPVVAVTKGSSSSLSELSGMLTLPRSPERPPSCTRADPWGLALGSPLSLLTIPFSATPSKHCLFLWVHWVGLAPES